MFTGIVEELGRLIALERTGDTALLRVAASDITADLHEGDSVAVDGCCLTVVDAASRSFTADVMAETLRRTCLGDLAPGSRVNLERATTAQTRLGGHLVQGHVDGVATIVARSAGERWDDVTFAVPADLLPYLAMKGSVAVDGVSLTVSALSDADATFGVSLIPTTLERTTLGLKRIGDRVDIEVDVIAKYVERLLAKPVNVAEED